MAVQVYELSSMHFLPKDWIMERWEEGFYITAMAGSAGGSSLVVMSKGTPYTQQSYKVGLLPFQTSLLPFASSYPLHARAHGLQNCKMTAGVFNESPVQQRSLNW